jgi:hypothetical protein
VSQADLAIEHADTLFDGEAAFFFARPSQSTPFAYGLVSGQASGTGQELVLLDCE